MTNKIKTTKLQFKYSEDDGATWWSTVDWSEDVSDRNLLATQLFGKPGTQCNRRWFWRITEEWYYIRVGDDKKWHSLPRRRLWYNMYFRSPKDATYFQLKS